MTDIAVYVLKPFSFSRNGIREERADAGKTIDIPERLFDALNDERYVRRAVIGDGRVSLKPTVVIADESHVVASQAKAVVTELNTKAPQSPVKAAELSEAEEQAIADGSWKSLKYFTKRSIAAKVSDQAIGSAADADAAIEAYIASKG